MLWYVLLLSRYETILCIVLAVVDLFVAVPMLLLLMFKKYQWVHKQVSSDIPGNPMAFNESVISAFRTLPEPSNFNIVWTGLPLSTGPLAMRGKIPGARCNSFNIYGAGTSEPPASVDAAMVPVAKDGSFTLIITQADVETTKKDLEAYPELKDVNAGFLVANKKWKMGFCAMRNYLVYPGTVVESPEIRRISDNSVVRASERLIAGPAGLVTHYSPLSRLLARVTLLHVAIFFLFHYCEVMLSFLDMNGCVDGVFAGDSSTTGMQLQQAATVLLSLSMPLDRLCYICVCSALLASVIIKLLYNSGRRGLSGMIMPICKNTYNKFVHSSIEQGSEVSQPSQLHQYWMCPLELKNNEALRIEMNINPGFQKYWSVVVYDEYGICLPQYVYDHLYLANTANVGCTNGTVTTQAADPSNKMVSGRWDEGWMGKSSQGVNRAAPYQATILLTNTKVASKAHKDSSETNVLQIDVSSARSGLLSSICKGYILFRLVHPSTNPVTATAITSNGKVVPLQDIVDFSSPKTTVVAL